MRRTRTRCDSGSRIIAINRVRGRRVLQSLDTHDDAQADAARCCAGLPAYCRGSLQPSRCRAEFLGVVGLAADRGASEARLPELTGALEGLRTLEASDLARYTQAVEAGKQLGWGYYFPYLMSRHRTGKSAALVEEDSGSICVYLWRKRGSKPKLDLLVAPTPMNTGALARCIERANDYNGSRSARVMRVDANDCAALVDMPWLTLKPRKPQYLYSPQEFGELAGRKYRTLRRNVASVQKEENLEVVPYSGELERGCRKMLRRWGKHHREAHGTAGGVGAIRHST